MTEHMSPEEFCRPGRHVIDWIAGNRVLANLDRATHPTGRRFQALKMWGVLRWCGAEHVAEASRFAQETA